jgi:hypothetical protein
MLGPQDGRFGGGELAQRRVAEGEGIEDDGGLVGAELERLVDPDPGAVLVGALGPAPGEAEALAQRACGRATAIPSPSMWQLSTGSAGDGAAYRPGSAEALPGPGVDADDGRRRPAYARKLPENCR